MVRKSNKLPKLSHIVIMFAILAVICLVIFLIIRFKKSPKPPAPEPEPPEPTIEPNFTDMALTASPGTGVIDMFPYVASGKDAHVDWNEEGDKAWPGKDKIKNVSIETDIYKNFMQKDISKLAKLDCKDLERSKLLSYLMGVYYPTDLDRLQRLSTDDLRTFYRCLVFYFITTQETQPDGGWYGSYWGKRILDSGPQHNKSTGQTNMTAIRNESFFFDSLMNSKIPDVCPGYNKVNDKCPSHTKFWGNRIFAEMCQSTLRRGMRNSPQVLRENPPWALDGKPNSRYGVGGFPSDSFVECLQFPQEHGLHGWPTGCDSATAKCTLKENFAPTRYQPEGTSRKQGGDPFCGQKPQWFYFSQGLGQFWNLGVTSYCYNYVDIFLNAPLGLGRNTLNGAPKAIGWSSGFSPCNDKLPFPPGGGVLGYDIQDPSKPTEHDYNDPVYSMKLLLEFSSRNDIPGGCNFNKNCSAGLKDPRTGMMGIGFCAAGAAGCPCTGKTGADFVTCLNQKGPGMGEEPTETTGCGPDQPTTVRGDSFNEQVAALMGLKAGTYWKPYSIQEIRSSKYINSSKGVQGVMNAFGGYDANPEWAKVRVKNCPKESYPVRDASDFTTVKDNRYIVTGWVNGHFYGYPKEKFLGDPKYKKYNPFEGGMPGTDPKTGKVIYGKHCTEADPLIYYDMYGKELYRTWYGKQLRMDEDTALRMMAEFYSCGDLGFDNMDVNWPFGCYFGYGQALGSPGKAATNAFSCIPYGCTTMQFTSTATAYGSVVQPAYDFEILYIPPVNSTSYEVACTCATAVSLDLTADFDSETPGEDLKRYLCLNKGSTGGYVPRDSPAGRTAVGFQGQYQKVTNWTDMSGEFGAVVASFDPTKKNKYGVDSNPQKLDVCSM